MVSILIIFTLCLCFCAKNTSFVSTNFTVDKTNLLKAALPFGIILYHLSFDTPQSVLSDFRFTGPYIVGLFFFMSGYGLEYQYHKGKITLKGLPGKLKKLFIPFIIPTISYLTLAVIIEKESIYSIFKRSLLDGQLLLPHTWFISVLVGIYLCYFVTRPFVKNNKVHLLILFLLFTFFAIMIKTPNNSHIYTSNYAFLIGMTVQQNEKRWIIWASKWYIYVSTFIIFALISFSYIENKPIFKGAGIIGVPLYVCAFMLFVTKIPAHYSTKITRFFSSISYEMYLFQGISILIINHFNITPLWIYVTSILILNILLSFISHKATICFSTLCHKR